MCIKNDAWIRHMSAEHNMITPFEPYQVRENGVISYGTSSFGYDMRIGSTFKVFRQTMGKMIRPKNIDRSIFHTTTVMDGQTLMIPPYSYVLGHSVETFNIPENILVIVIGKSTYARSGIIVNVTPGEPGWSGQWTIEIANATPLPVEIYPNEGIAQCVFFEGQKPELSYSDKNGKYQHQSGITLPLVEGYVDLKPKFDPNEM
jgi:dCTP deaminase